MAKVLISDKLSPQAAELLRSRGIDRETARGILTYAFACEAVTDIESQPVRDTIEQFLIDRYRQF